MATKKLPVIAHMPDLHFSSKRLGMCIESWSRLLNKAGEYNCNMIFIGGDISDSNNVGDRSVSTYKVVYGFYDPLREYLDSHEDAWCIAINGNHDIDYESGKSFLDIVPSHPRLIKISSPSVLYGIDFGFSKELTIIVLPWTANFRNMAVSKLDNNSTTQDIDKLASQLMKDWMKNISMDINENTDINDLRFFIGHFTLSNIQQESGFYDKVTLSIDDINNILSPDIIMMNHIHKPDQYYSGSMYHNSISDATTPTGFVLFNVGKKCITRKFIEVKTSRIHVIDINDTIEDLDNIDKLIVYVDNKEQALQAFTKFPSAEIRIKKEAVEMVTKRLDISMMNLYDQAMSLITENKDISSEDLELIKIEARKVVDDTLNIG